MTTWSVLNEDLGFVNPPLRAITNGLQCDVYTTGSVADITSPIGY